MATAKKKAPVKKKPAVKPISVTQEAEEIEEEVEDVREAFPIEDLEDDEEYDLPENFLEIGGELDSEGYDQKMVVEVFESNFVYRSKQVSPGSRIMLVKEEHFNPSIMNWVYRSNSASRSRKRFKKRAAKGTYRDAMQQLAIGGGGGTRDEPLA